MDAGQCWQYQRGPSKAAQGDAVAETAADQQCHLPEAEQGDAEHAEDS